jgi:hypothetical protein
MQGGIMLDIKEHMHTQKMGQTETVNAILYALTDAQQNVIDLQRSQIERLEEELDRMRARG